jgi:ferredoxin, 2Fe-2S
MPVVNVLQPDGSRVALEVAIGSSVMRAAVDAGVKGIVGECGGAAMCGTCHVLVDEQWLDRLPPMQRNEDELLDCTAASREWTSRLGCQLRMTEALDGLCLRMPERQR